MPLIEKMENAEYLSDSYQKIAAYILETSDAVLRMSVQQLAADTYTSPSTVVRFCRALGISGFQEFKIRYAQELEQKYSSMEHVDANFPFEKGDSVRTIAASLMKLDIESVNESFQLISANEDAFRLAANRIVAADKCILLGIGFSYTASLVFQNHMMRIGYHILTPSIHGELNHLSETCRKGDTAILLSYSGDTPSIVTAAEILHRHQTCIIALTSVPDSPLGRLADIVLQMPEKEEKFRRFANFSSQTCMTYYLNLLYSCIFVMNYDIHSKETIV